MFAGSIGYYILMVNILKHFGGTEISMGLSNYIDNGDGSIIDVIRNFIVNPGYVLKESFAPEKLTTLTTLPASVKRLMAFWAAFCPASSPS